MTALDSLIRGARMDREQATDWMRQVIRNELPAEVLAASLAILRHRGESSEELLGFLDALMEACVRVRWEGGTLLDPVGTGGDGLNTANLSTTAAFVIAAAGVPVAKHGNRAASSRSGSSDVLQAAGVPITDDIGRLEAALHETGIAFLFAPYHHPALRHVASVRKALGVMTSFNLLGPLANPAPVTHQFLGVSRAEFLETYATVSHQRGIRASVVHGHLGADEALPSGSFQLVRCQTDGSLLRETLDPEQLGVAPCSIEELRGGDAAHNAELLLDTLAGKAPRPIEDAVALNAGLALALAEHVADPAAGVQLARDLIRDGAPLRVLRSYQTFVRPS